MLKHLPSCKRAERVPGFCGEIRLSFESAEAPNAQLCKVTLRVTNNKAILLIVKIHLTAASTVVATGLKLSA